MTRRLLATVRNPDTKRCAKVYRDKAQAAYVVVTFQGPSKLPGEFVTLKREEAFTYAWGFAWPSAP
jgi:hypothetical protein